MKLNIDHIVVSTKNLKKSVEFYEVFLGKAKVSKWDASWQVGNTKLFLCGPYTAKPKAFDKHDIGLNHIAFGVKSLSDLKKYEKLLDKAGIKHSGIQKEQYSGKDFLWLDDPDKIRLEFYFRGKH